MPKTGPKAEHGKSMVKHDARQHGILSPAPVTPGLERDKDWEAFRDGILDDLQPVEQLELALAERAALNYWRMGRVQRFEVVSIAEEIRSRREPRSRTSRPAPAVERLNRLVNQLRAVEALARMRDLEWVNRRDAADAIDAACSIATVDAHDLDLPYARENPDWQIRSSWPVRDIRAAIASIIGPMSDGATDHSTGLSETLRNELASARADQEQSGREQRDHAGWRSLVPADSVLQQVTRYEAHLSRQAYQALHKLEALQAGRNGREAPLAGLDVTTDPQP